MKKPLLFLVFSFLFWVSPVRAVTLSPGTLPGDWPMAGANLERTSWNSEEVRGPFQPVWYRPIDPYIDNKVQVVTANNTIFLATSKGLYAFDPDTGAQKWVYGTELPLGHSPTVAYVNGKWTVYVGGYDRRVHAIDATTGQALSGYAPYEARAGYDTNPLIIQDSHTNNQPMILTGNRDGNFYAFDAITGSRLWMYSAGFTIRY